MGIQETALLCNPHPYMLHATAPRPSTLSTTMEGEAAVTSSGDPDGAGAPQKKEEKKRKLKGLHAINMHSKGP